MKLLITTVTAVLMAIGLNAQKHVSYTSLDPYADVRAELHYWDYQMPSEIDVALIEQILRNEFRLSEKDELRVTHTIKSLTATHVTFSQFYEGVEVIGGGAKVAISNNTNTLFRCIETIYNTSGNLGTLPQSFNSAIALSDYTNLSLLEDKPAYIWNGNQIVAGWFSQFNHDERGFSEAAWAANGDLILLRDKLMYAAADDTTITAKVFLPDPITPVSQVYGGSYVDANDQNETLLNAQQKSVVVRATYDNGAFLLINDHVEVVEHDAPFYPVVTKTVPNFEFSRSDHGFEQVNAFYHITAYQDYLQQIGFSLVQYPIQVDAQGWGGQDNSSFDFSSQPHPSLSFGEGGVDDAEDADVVIHEYGHAISYSASPNSNVGNERRSLDEALGDYLAVSYTKDIYAFGSNRVFNWDGHNEFWTGRTVHNPQNICYDNITSFGNIYAYTTVFNAAMFEIWDQLGKVYTDKLMIEAAHGYFQNMIFSQAALMVLDADMTFTGGGSNTYTIWEAFDNHCILNWSSVEESESAQRLYELRQNSNYLNVVLNANEANYSLIDITGRQIAKGNLRRGENTIRLNALNAGIYVLNVYTESISRAEKIIIAR